MTTPAAAPSELKVKIQSELTTAMKARDAARVQALRNITSAMKKKEVDERKDLSSAEIEKILRTMEKQLGETLEQAKGAGRAESVNEAEFELGVIRAFLPKQMSAADLDAVVVKIATELKAQGLPAGGAGMGQVMKAVMAAVGGAADGKAVQAAVKKALEG